MSNIKISNGDAPAMPLVDGGFGRYEPEVFCGLTKREKFAAMAMQGFMASGKISKPDELISAAVNAADKLLAELEK